MGKLKPYPTTNKLNH